MCRFCVSLSGLLLVGLSLRADEPKREVLPVMPRPAVEALPPPLAIVEMGPLGPVRPGYFQPDPRAVWQLYAIDKQGFYKPRVVFAPQSYYLYNGKPYRFLQVLPQDYTTDPRPR
jgi:hypothetical protein